MAHTEPLGVAGFGGNGSPTETTAILTDLFVGYDYQRFFRQALFERGQVAFRQEPKFHQPRIVLGTARISHGAIGGGFKLGNLILLRPSTRGNTLWVCHSNSWALARNCRFGSSYRLSSGWGFSSLSGFSFHRGLSDHRSRRSTGREGHGKDSEQHYQGIKSFLGHFSSRELIENGDPIG